MSSGNRIKMSEISAQNAIIFISDALRWDFLPERVAKRGRTYKTIAQSTATNTSIPSILTGQYPPRHRINDWSHSIPQEVESVFHHPVIDATYDTLNTWWQEASPIYDMLDIEQGREFDDLSEPFVYVIHDKGGHAPYDGKRFSDFDSQSALLTAYQRSVSKSAERFGDLLTELDNDGLRNDTLIVFTSDHGELLGKEGFCGHGYPMCPELIYVPTTFIHPDISSNKMVESGVIEHIDLLPTVFDALEVNGYELDGESLFNRKIQDYGLSFRDHYHQTKLLNQGYVARGYFEWNGSYVFHKANLIKRLIHFLVDQWHGQKISPKWKSVLSPNSFRQFRKYTGKTVTYGEPAGSIEKAENLLSEITKQAEYHRRRTELDDETKDAMEDLGYL